MPGRYQGDQEGPLETHASTRRAMAGVGSRPLGTHQGRQVPVGGGGQVDQVPGVIGGVRYLRGRQHSSL